MDQSEILLVTAAFFSGIFAYRLFRSKAKTPDHQYRQALQQKYMPEIFHHAETVSYSSRQIKDLDQNERDDYEQRDSARNQNISFLRLLVEDLFDDQDEPNKNELQPSSTEERENWIQEKEAPLNEHASLVQQEEIGSGIVLLDSINPQKDDLDVRVKREGGKSGEVQVSLTWDDFNDLDLHLFCPSGERIYFNNRESSCGGELDIDMNVRPTSKNPVENVVWTKEAPLGKYKIGVHFYKHHKKRKSTSACEFRLRVMIHGVPRDYAGKITYGQAMQMVTSFTIEKPA